MSRLNEASQWRLCTGGCTCPDHDVPLYTSTFSDDMLENSGLVRLARSNEEPLPAEAAALNGMIAEYSERISALDSRAVDLRELRTTFLRQISSIDEELNHILGEREKLSVAIDTRRKFLSPVRRLPPELLCRIFHETVEKTIPRSLSKRERGWWDFRDVTSPLWTIELVCRRWKEAVVSFPELWSYLNIVVTDDNFMGTYRYTRLLSRQFARSKQHLLTVSIHHDTEGCSSQELPGPLIALLFSASERIQRLTLAMSFDAFSSLQPLRLFFPSLEHLRLLCTDSLGADELGGIVLFEGVPKLWSVDVMDIPHLSWSFTLPWNQITHFTSDHAYLHDAEAYTLQILDQLRSMPNVEECRLRCEAWDDGRITEEQPQVICRKLRSLNLSSRLIHQRPLFQILNQLTTPVMSSLSFDGSSYNKELDVENTFTAIRNLIGRSHNPLKTLRFFHGLVLTEDILSILCSTSTLETIWLIHVPLEAFTRSFFDKLTIKPTVPPSDATIILPRLRLFHLSGIMSKDFDAEGFVGMIASRCQQINPSVARLDYVLLRRFVPPEDPDENTIHILSRLDKLQSTGVAIGISERIMRPSEKSVW
ncbi:hypothetical protein IW261DRAFT_1455803 [Armillaria novae-zelandiae]|uniref:F-box domain-containing protein n=1 Tax=Armillaria novae-zelandiae TaxID=153914 RepID=A0AA39UNW2_9AGAR|nr:hypothetical protein IW261DRAFT_1455803 [Armillaria novae-zelandiae]